MLTVELLERIVRQDHGLGLLGDHQHERVTTPDGTRGRRYKLVVLDRFVELGNLARVDAMTEGGIDDNRDDGVRVVL